MFSSVQISEYGIQCLQPDQLEYFFENIINMLLQQSKLLFEPFATSTIAQPINEFSLLNIIISVMGTIVISLCNSILLLRVD